MIAYERRASTVLFNVVRTQGGDRPYLVPANACPILAITLMHAGAPFELIDISSASMAIDADAVLDRVRTARGRYAGLVFVRPYGSMSDEEAFFREFKQCAPGAIIVDDRCLCSPSFAVDPAGAADVVLYSTGHAKAVDIGWGGYGVLAEGRGYGSNRAPFDPLDLERLTSGYKHALASGAKFQYVASRWLDMRKPPIGWDRYRESVERNRTLVQAHRRLLNRIYRERIPAELQYSDAYQEWRFNVRAANAPDVLAALFTAGLYASRHYVPLTRAFGNGDAPNAEAVYRQIVNLFNDLHFSAEQAGRAADIVRKVAIPIAPTPAAPKTLRYA